MKHMEKLRRKLVYELFIEHLIAMAQVSIKYRALQQTMGLLKQADRLCMLLSDDKFHEESEKQAAVIEAMRQSVQNIVQESVNQGPELPRRESIAEKEAIRIRYRPEQPSNYSQIGSPRSRLEEVPSDDDNDEIYNYHQSVIAQIHATSAENLARFQHTDEGDDDVEEITNSIERLEANLKQDNSDYESDTATKL